MSGAEHFGISTIGHLNIGWVKTRQDKEEMEHIERDNLACNGELNLLEQGQGEEKGSMQI